jgi:hypothetical protein
MTGIDVALDGRWTDWHGLDPALDPAGLTDRFGPGRRHGPMLELAAGMQAYVEDGRVLLVQLDDPVARGGVAATLAALGPPELRQPARHVRYGDETTDHVYPGRGLALVVAVAYDHAAGPDHAGGPDQTPRLVRAELFAPTDLATWRANWSDLGAPRPPLR